MKMTKLFSKVICVLLGSAMLAGSASAEYPVISAGEYSDSTLYLADTTVSAEWDGTVAAAFDGGTGTEADPYRIASGEQLALLAQYVNSNNADYVSAYYTLTADILLNDDINSEPNLWTSIGTKDETWPDSSDRPFRGTFDGANHKIIGLYQTGSYAFGLFAYISESATVKNLSVTDGKIVSGNSGGIGAICGVSKGKISNCTNSVCIIIATETSGQSGGVCGINNGGTIENCCNMGEVYTTATADTIGGVCGQLYGGTISGCQNEGNVSGKDNIGGVCGSASDGPAGDPAGSVSNCCNTANITGNNYVGGVCGYSVVPVSECYNNGAISGASYIGGVCGSNGYFAIKDSYNSGNITGSVQYIGGVCGYYSNNSGATEDIIRCYNTGIVRNTLETTYPTYGYTGGICGWYNGNILSQCYNTGNVTVNDTYYTGGICGKAGNSSGTAKISECCNSGAVKSAANYVGGLSGQIDGCAIENCYNTGAVEGAMYVGGLWGDSSNDSVTNCYNIGAVTATETSARNPYLYPAGEKDGGIFTNVYYNSDVNVDIYNQNPDWGRTTAQLTAQTAISDLGFDTEKWSKTANTSEYLYYPDLKNIANDNPAFSTSTPLPTGLTASAEFYSITLTWDEFSCATKYAVYYSTDGSNYILASDTVTDTKYTITQLTPAQKYYFKIKAYVSDAWTYSSKTIDADTDSLYIKAHSLLLGDDIGVKFYIRLADSVIADESAYIKFTVNGKEIDLLVKDVNYDSYYGYEFICPVAAAEINDIIKGQLYVGGKAVGDEFTYSVKTYADYILENSAEYPDEVPLVNAMLNYGAAAEKYFRGSTDISFTKPDVSAANLALFKYIYTDNDSDIDFVGQVISLKNKITAKLYFSGKNFAVSDFNVTQNSVAVEASRLTVGSDTNGTYLAISGIAADKMGEPFVITIGGVTISNYSAFSYVQGALNSSTDGLADVVAALYAYGSEAENYSKI